VTRDETNWFLEQIDAQNFWKRKSIEGDRGVDGAQWIIEGVRSKTYHVVDRWSPKDGSVRALRLFMANDLARMQLASKDVF
jgi:hypothetical protein